MATGTVSRLMAGVAPVVTLMGEVPVMLVTVPLPGVVQVIAVPLEASTCPFVPTVVRPVPPLVTETGVVIELPAVSLCPVQTPPVQTSILHAPAVILFAVP